MSWRLVSAGLVAVVVLAGCGDDASNTTGGPGGAGGGNGGAGGQGTGGDVGTSTGGGGAGQGGQGGQSGAQCGGLAGETCPDDAWCDFGDNSCGVSDGIGTCTPRPQGCPDLYDPVCACDGMVYGNECDANAVGQDVSNAGGCQPPQDTLFACGPKFCTSDLDYCQRQVSDVVGYPDEYACMPVPPCAPPGVDCQCLSAEPCGAICDMLPSGDYILTCPGG